MSNIQSAAIASINEQRHLEAREKAKRLILAIANVNGAIKARTENLVQLNADLKKLANDKFTAVEIVGPMPSTQSTETILETIRELNQAEQSVVASQCAQLDAAIRREQCALDSENFNRTELRKRLSEITVENITTDSIA
jgi:flagellar motility protein MotE (MotC chaperone)